MNARRPFPRRFRPAFMGFAGLTLFLIVCAPKKVPSRPNLLLITIDTLRADRVGVYSGGRLPTPQMDSLAARGTVFTRAFSHCTTTLPAHANIMLGTTPVHHGVHDNANFVVGGGWLTLAEHLKGSGYSTGAFIGGFPLESRFGLDQGYDTYDDRLDRIGPTPGDSWTRRADAVLAAALGWLKIQRSPWFLWIHFWDPHEPYSPPEPYATQYAGRPYDGEVAYVDAVLGDLFRHMKDSSLFDSSLVVLTGDHGESLGEHGEKGHGFLAYNTTLWVPLMIAFPGWSPRVVAEPVSHVDIFPTVCDLLGLGRPGFLQGRSLVPAMKGERPRQETVYFESLTPYYSMGWAPVAGFIENGRKFIDSPVPEIYDLDRDFDETTSLAEPVTTAAGRARLDDIVRTRSSERAAEAEAGSSRETIERLRSLGYVANFRTAGTRGREGFGPEDDVKSLLPYYNKTTEAMDLYRAGKVREAIELAREVIRARKNISTAYLHLANFLKESGRPGEAVAVMKAGYEALPGNYYVFLEYLTSLYEAGEFDAVLRVFEGPRPAQAEFDPLAWHYAGLSWLKKGESQKAWENFEKALAIDPDFSVSWYLTGNLHYAVFMKSGDRARLKLAEECERKAMALDQANGPAHYMLGVVLCQQGDDGGAVPFFEKALALDPELHDALYYLGLVHVRRGDASNACSYFKRFRGTPGFDLLSPDEKTAIEDIIARCSK